MDNYTKIKQLLREIVRSESLLVRGTVTKISGETCSVKLHSGLVVSDIRLKAIVSEQTDRFLLTPAVGSDVLIFDGTVIQVDTVSKLEFSQNGLKVSYDGADKKVCIENETVNLLGAILALTDMLKNSYQLITPNGPTSGVVPTSLATLTQIETKFKQLLK